jgi:transcriptional regulator with XRE-family HTH domain
MTAAKIEPAGPRDLAITTIDTIVNELDALRTERGITKAELARTIGKLPASVRRLFTAPANPELSTLVAIADALEADVLIVPRRPPATVGT